jgi:hypothetical protein
MEEPRLANAMGTWKKWSLVCPFTGKDVFARQVLALELLCISSISRITTVIMVLLEGKYATSLPANAGQVSFFVGFSNIYQ